MVVTLYFGRTSG